MAFPISACAIWCLPQIEQVVQHVELCGPPRPAEPLELVHGPTDRGQGSADVCPTSWTVNTDVFAHYDRQAVNSTSSGSFLA
jgi:hypothetical protein